MFQFIQIVQSIVVVVAIVLGWITSGIILGSLALLIKAVFQGENQFCFIKTVFALTLDDWYKNFIQFGPFSVLFVPLVVLFSYNPHRQYNLRSIREWERLGLNVDQYHSHGEYERSQIYAQKSIKQIDSTIESVKHQLDEIPVKTKRFAWATTLATMIMIPLRSGIAVASDVVKLFLVGGGSGTSATFKATHRDERFGWEITVPNFPGKRLAVQAGTKWKAGECTAFTMAGPGITTDGAAGATVKDIVVTSQLNQKLPLRAKIFSVQEWTQPLVKKMPWQYFTDNVLTVLDKKYKIQAQLTATRKEKNSFAWRYGPRVERSFARNKAVSFGWLWNGQNMVSRTADLKLVYSF